MSPRLVLVGPPGAGKSTVGAHLARRWQVAFADSDDLVEAMAGRTVSDIFVVDGEPAFRELERAAVAQAIAEHDGVLALGGGAVLDASTRSLLVDQPVVQLTVGASAAAARVGLNRDRPLLLGNVRTQLQTLLKERAPFYDEVARWTVDTDDLDPDGVCDLVESVMKDDAR
jgi:shikimate kinase